MRKWPIILLSLVLTGLCVAALVVVVSGYDRDTSPNQTAQSTLQQSVPPQTTVAIETTVQTEPAAPAIDPPDMSASTATHIFVYDAGSDRLLYTLGDQGEKIAPASLTKLFTAYVALQYLDPDSVITVGEEAGWIAPDSSIAAVSTGNRLSIELVVQGMLMQSGNDAAYALAVAAGRAIEDNDTLAAGPAFEVFIKEMNAQAQSLGLTGTHFANPDGYDAEDHYTTASDLLEISKLAMTQPLIVQCCKTDTEVVFYESGEEYTWKNTNWLLREDMEEFYCPEATGLKTGSTSQAGMCMIATFYTGETTLVIGVMGCEEIEQRFADALLLFEHYR